MSSTKGSMKVGRSRKESKVEECDDAYVGWWFEDLCDLHKFLLPLSSSTTSLLVLPTTPHIIATTKAKKETKKERKGKKEKPAGLLRYLRVVVRLLSGKEAGQKCSKSEKRDDAYFIYAPSNIAQHNTAVYISRTYTRKNFAR
jgi:hypothetical protein